MRIGRFLLTAVITASAFTAMAAPQADKDKMDQFIDNLMGKMTLQEKIGQLNLPVSGEIVTGQAKSSDVAGKIRKGQVGGLFNVKGVENIREVQKIAVEQSRLKIPLLFGMDVIEITMEASVMLSVSAMMFLAICRLYSSDSLVSG